LFPSKNIHLLSKHFVRMTHHDQEFPRDELGSRASTRLTCYLRPPQSISSPRHRSQRPRHTPPNCRAHSSLKSATRCSSTQRSKRVSAFRRAVTHNSFFFLSSSPYNTSPKPPKSHSRVLTHLLDALNNGPNHGGFSYRDRSRLGHRQIVGR
jgi:hypothetical protein